MILKPYIAGLKMKDTDVFLYLLQGLQSLE